MGKKYDVNSKGIITAVRIYNDDKGIMPMAELAFAYGEPVTICWADTEQRGFYMGAINGYTLFFDEREKVSFENFRH